MLRATLLALSLALSAAQVSADTIDDAYNAYQRGDFVKAAIIFRMLADKGNAAAQSDLAVMFQNGEGVSKDYAKAARWYRRAAQQGVASAKYELGLMYYNGEGVPKDYAEAARWYRRAAKQGVASAHFNLGVMYLHGEGVLQNNIMVHMWLNLASANGHEEAGGWRDKLAARMTAADISKAQAMARECMNSGYKNCGD